MRSKSVPALASLLRPRRLAASSHSHRGRCVIPHEHVRPAAAPTCCSEDGAAVNQTCTPGVLRRARRNRPQSYTRSVPLRKRCRRPTQMYPQRAAPQAVPTPKLALASLASGGGTAADPPPTFRPNGRVWSNRMQPQCHLESDAWLGAAAAVKTAAWPLEQSLGARGAGRVGLTIPVSRPWTVLWAVRVPPGLHSPVPPKV